MEWRRWMGQHVQDAARQKISMKVFVAVLSLGASVSGSLVLSQPANALSLPLADISTSLLHPVLPASADGTPAAPAPPMAPLANSSPSQPSSSAAAVAPQSPPSKPSAPKAPSLQITPAASPPLTQTPAPLDANWQSLSKNNTARLATANVNGVSASSPSSFAFLQPSDQGWQLFGIVWYWWLLAAAIVFSIVRYRRYIKHFRLFKKPLVS